MPAKSRRRQSGSTRRTSGADRPQRPRRARSRASRRARALGSASSPRRALGSSSRATASRSFAAVFGPMPGTSSRRPVRTASRNSAAVRAPSARPIATARCGDRPRNRPRPTSSGSTSPSSSRAWAISPVSTSSRRRASSPGPDPAQLAHAPGPHELGDRRGQRPDHVGGTPIRADDVVRRAGEVEQRRVALERIGDRRVVEG